MSILTNKRALVIGEENSQIFNLTEALSAHGVVIEKLSCANANIDKITELRADFIILNYVDRETNCINVLNLLRDSNMDKIIPIFALVDESTGIQDVLSRGAADYVTSHEDVQSVVQKIKAVFNQGDGFSGGAAIDITPHEAAVTATGIRVYIVEDDPLLRNLLSLRFNKSSFPYEFSEDGKLAVSAMKQFKPDVIILDLMLPGKSGFEVLTEIKAEECLKEIPVIVFSNRDGQADKKKAEELGAVAFYVKVMTDLSELVETIESLAK